MSVGSSRHHGGNGGGGGHSSVWQLYRLPFAVLAFSIWICLYSLSSFVHLPEQLGLTQQCRMSRMWPAYIDHTQNLQPFSPSGLWRKYRLYLYRERNYDPMDLPSGSPALFVPGNAGSYAQIRSVASSAARQFYEVGGSGARKDEWKNAPVGKAHTDWYTVDFNEDFSAFSGSTIVEQATFLNEVLAYLRNRYASEPTRQYAAGERNTSVPILAHSMGGIAARLTQHLDNYLSDSVDTIVTLSTPHAYPPVPFDRSIERVYSRINDPATLPRSTSGAPPLIVSIAGGLLDTQLPSDPASVTLARLSETTPASRISTFTSSLPSLWSSVDHLAVMWCDQLREKIARAFLLDSMAFGRISTERTAGGVSGLGSELRKRRELWRRALSLFESADAGNADMGPVELIRDRQSIYDDDRQPYVVDSELASLNVPAQSILSSNETHWTYRVPAQVEGDVSVYTFELLTNLCIGGNPSSGMGPPIPQPVELVVMTCSGAPDPGNPTGGRRAACQVVLPWQWELIPPSFLPRTDLMAKPPQGSEVMPEDKSFPLADEIYHVPGLAYQRLRLDPVVLRRKQIDYIRIERRVATGALVFPRGLKSFVRAGWHSSSAGAVSKHGSRFTLLPDTSGSHGKVGHASIMPQHLAVPISYQWSLPSAGSALLARRIEIVPSQCLLRNLASYTLNSYDRGMHVTEPSFSPFMHISDPSTGDSRWYPQLISSQLVRKIRNHEYDGLPIRLPLSLHGAAPFLPPSRPSLDELRVQIWSDPALLKNPRGSMDAQDDCAAPVEKVIITVDWKATTGLVLMRYRLFLAAWPLGLLAVCLGAAWFKWSVGQFTVFPSPLANMLRPPVEIRYLSRLGPLGTLLVAVPAVLVVVDTLRLAIYRSSVDGSNHGPTSSLLGMVLGLHDNGLSMLLIPTLVLVSYAALLVIVMVSQFGFAALAQLTDRIGLDSRIQWGSLAPSTASGPPRWKPRSLAGLALLLLSVVLCVPHQFVFLCVFLLQLFNTLRSALDVLYQRRHCGHVDSGSGYRPVPSASSSDRMSQSASINDGTAGAEGSSVESRYHQHLSFSLVLLLLLPQKASFLVTWIRNLTAVGVQTPKTSASWMDHHVLDIAPILVLIWIFAGGRGLERARTRIEAKLLTVLFGAVAWYALVLGIRYTYAIYDAFNLLSGVLGLCHWRSRHYGSGIHAVAAAATTKPYLVHRDRSSDSDHMSAAEEFELLEADPEDTAAILTRHAVKPAA